MVPDLLSNCLPPALHYPIFLFWSRAEISISSFNSNGVTDLTKCHILNDFEDHTAILKCFLTLIQIILMKFF